MSCKTCILKQLLASAVCNNAGPDANIVDLQSRLHIINPCISFIVLSCHVSNTLERHGLLENSTLALWLFSTCGVFVAYPCPHSHVPNVGYLNMFFVSWGLSCKAKRLRRLGHVCRMHTARRAKELVFGEVKSLCPPGRPRS